MNWHLIRVEYGTDYDPREPDVPQRFSASIPDSALRDGRQIVGIDWSEPGWVWVTYLVPGDGAVTDRG